jgi:hypothetical protein
MIAQTFLCQATGHELPDGNRGRTARRHAWVESAGSKCRSIGRRSRRGASRTGCIWQRHLLGHSGLLRPTDSLFFRSRSASPPRNHGTYFKVDSRQNSGLHDSCHYGSLSLQDSPLFPHFFLIFVVMQSCHARPSWLKRAENHGRPRGPDGRLAVAPRQWKDALPARGDREAAVHGVESAPLSLLADGLCPGQRWGFPLCE